MVKWFILGFLGAALLFGNNVEAHAQTSGGSWRTVSAYFSSVGNGNWDAPYGGMRVSRPDICANNFSSYDALRACLLAGGESPLPWSSSPSAVTVKFYPPVSATANTTLGQVGTGSGFRVAAHDRITGDSYYNGSNLGVFSSSDTVIAWSCTNRGVKNPVGPSYCTSGSPVFIAYNPNVEPYDPEVYNECLVDAAVTADLRVAKVEYLAIQVPDVATYPDYGGTLKRPDDECVWVVGPPENDLRDPADPQVYIGCLGVYYNNDDGTYATTPTTNVFRTCPGHTNGDVWPPLTDVGQYVEAPSNMELFVEKPVEFPGVQDFVNGVPVNGAPGSVIDSVMGGAGDFADFCDTFQVAACDRPVKEIIKDPCTEKGFTHIGNRDAQGGCTGYYDKDWPSVEDVFDPDKGWVWAPPPATRDDVVSGGLVIVGPGNRGVVRPAPGNPGNDGPVQYPPGSGGGDSDTNPPVDGEVPSPGEPEPDPGEGDPGPPGDAPDMPGISEGGFYTSAYPDGISDVWGEYSTQMLATPMMSSIGVFGIPAGGWAQDGDLDFGSITIGPLTGSIVLPDLWLDLGAILTIIAASIAAFRHVVG